jgi:ATP-dependent exoDNAse (exonuclease V) alpha subunit
MVRLNPKLHILCYKLLIKTKSDILSIYDPVVEKDREKIDNYYKHEAWNKVGKKEQAKAFKARRLILSCFAEVKHFYAATSHRLQGASIPNVIVITSDIYKNKNLIEAKKCLFVAASRAIDSLKIYRGI